MKLTLPVKTPQQLADQARELAEQEASERGVPIDRICIAASPFGHFKVIVLDD